MTDTIEEIRQRHTEYENAKSKSYLQLLPAHADRATLLRALDEALAKLERYESLIRAMIENEPDDAVSDGGHTVLDLWRHDARAALKETQDE